MMSEQLQIDDYYGYNSIIDSQGRRIRRMHRTEASAQKLLIQKVKSPYRSRDPSSQRSRASQNQRSNLTGSVNRPNSGLKFHRQKNTKNNIQKQSQSYHSVSNFDSEKSKGMNGLQSNPVLKRFGGVKEAMGQYYIGNQSKMTSKATKQQLRSYRSKQKGSKYQEVRQKSKNYQKYINSNEESRRTLKKTENSYEVTPFQLHQNIQYIKRKEQKDISQTPQLKKRQSNIQSHRPKSNTKKSEVSSLSKNNNSKMSQILHSNNELLVKSSKLLKRNKIKMDQSLMKSADSKNDYNVDASQKGLISKKSSVNIILPNQKSDISQSCSNSQSYASRLRSKIKDIQEKSKISKINEFHEEQDIKASTPKVKAGTITKKSTTQTTESDQNLKINESPKISRKIKRLSNPNKKSVAISEQKFKQLDDKSDSLIQKQQSLLQSQPSKNKNQLQSSNQKIQPKNIKFSLGLTNQKHVQLQQSMKINKKKSVGNYTFNDVVQNIQQHDIRICSLYLFVDSTKSLYETPLKFERYQRLCFLMMKKYKYEKDRIVESLEAGQSCFQLTDAEIPTQVMKKHVNRMEVRQRLAAFIDQFWKISQQLEVFYNIINKKYQKDKYINLDGSKDNFSPQIVRLLMEQMSKLYLQLQKEDMQNDVIDNNQQRIIQIVQIMFLISQLNGRFVRKFQLFQENQIYFQEYYSQNYERIMETAEYFEKYA